jgi:transcription elongation factor GreA
VAKEIVLTREGYEKLKTELEELMTSRRAEVAARIAQAREFGDISENSEYDDAKNEQAMLEQQIAQLEERLRDARVIEEGELPSDEVVLGSHVTIDGPTGKETYQVVGSAEADPDENRLSNESPIGRAILGRRKGDKVDVTTPGGQVTVKIVEISVT